MVIIVVRAELLQVVSEGGKFCRQARERRRRTNAMSQMIIVGCKKGQYSQVLVSTPYRMDGVVVVVVKCESGDAPGGIGGHLTGCPAPSLRLPSRIQVGSTRTKTEGSSSGRWVDGPMGPMRSAVRRTLRKVSMLAGQAGGYLGRLASHFNKVAAVPFYPCFLPGTTIESCTVLVRGA